MMVVHDVSRMSSCGMAAHSHSMQSLVRCLLHDRFSDSSDVIGASTSMSSSVSDDDERSSDSSASCASGAIPSLLMSGQEDTSR